METAELQVSVLPRVFVYDDEEYPDPNPDLPAEEVIEILSAIKPELATGYIETTENEPEKIIYNIKSNLGTKA